MNDTNDDTPEPTPGPTPPVCHLCHGPADDADWCFGCEHYVCERCDGADLVCGPHEVSAHGAHDAS